MAVKIVWAVEHRGAGVRNQTPLSCALDHSVSSSGLCAGEFPDGFEIPARNVIAAPWRIDHRDTTPVSWKSCSLRCRPASRSQ